MVSIQHVAKRNEMSEELQKHGFAADYEEAIEQADQIYSTERESPDVAFSEGSAHEEQSLMQRTKETMEEAERSGEEENEEAVDDSSTHDELRERVEAIEQALEEQSESEQRLDTVIQKVNEIVKAINELEDRQDALEQQLDGDVSNTTKEQQEASEADTSDDTDSSDENPGTGDYGPDDVAVENVFYSGDS